MSPSISPAPSDSRPIAFVDRLPPITPAQVATWQRDGLLLAGPLLDSAAVDALRAELDRVITERDRADVPQPTRIHNMGGGGSEVWQIVNIWQASPAFAALLRLPTLIAAAKRLAGTDELRLWHDQIQYKPAAIGGVNRWHQDGPYWGVLTPKTSQLTAWIALDDADTGNGCMAMVAGSHRWGDAIPTLHAMHGFDDLPETYADEPVRRVACPVAAGWVHFHHSLTWHGSPANTSGRKRRAIALHLMTGETRYHGPGTHLLKPGIQVDDGAKLEGDLFPRLGVP